MLAQPSTLNPQGMLSLALMDKVLSVDRKNKQVTTDTLHPAPFTLHPTPYTLHPEP